MCQKETLFYLLEKLEIIRKAKDYNDSKADFINFIGILDSTWQKILKQADLMEQNLEKKRKLVFFKKKKENEIVTV